MITPRWHLREAARRLHQGGLIAYPTEAVYGLGCDPLNEDAVMRLLRLKQRSVAKGLILVAADFDQLTPFVQPLSDDVKARVLACWPGPTTWLLAATTKTPKWVTGCHPTLAVRITDHPLPAALCRCCASAIVSTSANISRRTPARSALGVYTRFDDQLDYILHGALGYSNRPTQIRDALSGKVVRA